MEYLGTGLGVLVSGPDFMGNSRLNLLFEEWRAGWSPLVEARLIELAADGLSIEALCLAKLRREEVALGVQGRGRSASGAVALLLRACLVGLQTRLPELISLLAAHLNEDAKLGSVVDCGHRLITLWRAREPLGVQQHPQLEELLQRVWPSALFLLTDLASCAESDEAGVVRDLLSMRELGRMTSDVDPGHGMRIDLEPLRAQLERFASSPVAAPGVCGASAAMLYLDGHWDELVLSRVVTQRFGPGASPPHAVRFLKGLMAAAPELLSRLPILLEGVDTMLGEWEAEQFVTYLPELRQVFTGLKPQETDEVARRVAHRSAPY